MNIIAIDPSLVSTALIVSSGDSFKIYNYCRESAVFGKKGIRKWFGFAEEYVTYRFVKYRTFDNYSDGELIKLKDYDDVTDNIIEDILKNIDPDKHTRVGIEGYNFGAQVGDLLDLVTFSTLLRKKLYDRVTNDIIVMSPSTLKLDSCKLTYEPIIKEIGIRVKKTKIEHRNNLGIPGGKFTKNDMYLAIIENNKISDYWIDHCKLMKQELTSVSTIPKPYEDVNDSFLIYHIIKGYR